MTKTDTSAYQTFGEITDRLDEIIGTVRDKDTSLERSLDLFDEAIDLGSKAVDLVDKVDFTSEEKARLADADLPGDGGAAGGGTPSAADRPDEG